MLFTMPRQNGPFGDLARSVIDYVIIIIIIIIIIVTATVGMCVDVGMGG
jgi:hypothetical protein